MMRVSSNVSVQSLHFAGLSHPLRPARLLIPEWWLWTRNAFDLTSGRDNIEFGFAAGRTARPTGKTTFDDQLMDKLSQDDIHLYYVCHPQPSLHWFFTKATNFYRV
jgi:hypothetical protein